MTNVNPKKNLLIYGKQIAESDTRQVAIEQPEEVEHSKRVQVNTAEVNAAHDWLDINDDDGSDPSKDILEIIRNCLKEVKRLKTGRLIKMMTQLTAVAEYVKLRIHFQAQSQCEKPCLNASLAIAR